MKHLVTRKSWIKNTQSLALPLCVAFLQTAVLYIQPFRPSGDDPIRIAAVGKLATGNFPSMKFSIIHPGFFAALDNIFSRLGLGGFVIEHNGAILWALWSITMIFILKKYRGNLYIAAALSFVFFSMLAPYLVGFNTEAFSALGVSAGLALALLSQHRLSKAIGWAVTILSTANVPVVLMGAVICSIYLVVAKKRLRYFLYPAGVLLVILIEASFARRHFAISKYGISGESGISPLLPWGEVVGFGYPVFFGMLAIVFSFGRGIIFFVPNLFTSFKKSSDELGVWLFAQLFIIMALIPLYGAWWAWYGGVTFGPRFFMLACIVGGFGLAELLVANSTQNSIKKMSAVVLLVAYSTWVSIIGVSYFITPRVAQMCMQNSFRYEPLCWYSPEYSTIFAPLWEGGAVTWQAKIFTWVAVACVVGVSSLMLYRLWRLSMHRLRSLIHTLLHAQWRL